MTMPNRNNETTNLMPNSKEEYINHLQQRISAREKQMEILAERMTNMQAANRRDLLKLDETRLLKDIRDGRVSLVHTETGKPITVHVFSN